MDRIILDRDCLPEIQRQHFTHSQIQITLEEREIISKYLGIEKSSILRVCQGYRKMKQDEHGFRKEKGFFNVKDCLFVYYKKEGANV